MERPMTFGDFQAEAARTGGTDLRPDRQMQGLVCAALGLAGEAAEVLSGALFPNTMTGSDFGRSLKLRHGGVKIMTAGSSSFFGLNMPSIVVTPLSAGIGAVRASHLFLDCP